ncbi:hypothetical protein PoB_005800200 [Plakobranchus ocellatus]|uniref:Uncharacterized protein n=1 Tax=Plakobranchus ocellatus TaxID=259542 RepID=A0AAV4CIK1_9GAST|nr:hypothetical protein PoB_005800200 [Plakobranchus ocellatus]
MPYYIPERTHQEGMVFNHLHNNQGALHAYVSGSRNESDGSSSCTVPTATSKDKAAKGCEEPAKLEHPTGISPIGSACSNLYYFNPYFFPPHGLPKRKPVDFSGVTIKGRRHQPRDRMFYFADQKILNDRAFGPWDSKFGAKYFYKGDRRL